MKRCDEFQIVEQDIAVETCSICGKDIEIEDAIFLKITAEGKPYFPVCKLWGRSISRKSEAALTKKELKNLKSESYSQGCDEGKNESHRNWLGCICLILLF